MKKAIILLVILISITALVNAQVKKPRPTQAMPDMYVDGLLTAMKNQRGDEAKLSLIQNAIKNNTDGIMVDQELKLMNQFATDDGKLECAKFLYPWAVDYKNYAKIQYNLGSATAQKTLTDFIKKQGNK